VPNDDFNETKILVFIGFMNAKDINKTINIAGKYSELTAIK
jgi:hypothetical protein